MGKALADGLVGLRRDPKPLGGLVPPGLDHDPPGNQLALAPGVGGDDKLAHVAALHQPLHHPELPGSFGDDHKLHGFGEHGQILHAPFFQLFVVDVGVRQRDQMPQGPGHNAALALEIALAALAAAQHAG